MGREFKHCNANFGMACRGPTCSTLHRCLKSFRTSAGTKSPAVDAWRSQLITPEYFNCSHLHLRAPSDFFRPFFQIAASGTTLLNGSQLLIFLITFAHVWELLPTSQFITPIFAAFSQSHLFGMCFFWPLRLGLTQLRLGGKASPSNPSLRSNPTGKGLLLLKGVRVDLSCVAFYHPKCWNTFTSMDWHVGWQTVDFPECWAIKVGGQQFNTLHTIWKQQKKSLSSLSWFIRFIGFIVFRAFECKTQVCLALIYRWYLIVFDHWSHFRCNFVRFGMFWEMPSVCKLGRWPRAGGLAPFSVHLWSRANPKKHRSGLDCQASFSTLLLLSLGATFLVWFLESDPCTKRFEYVWMDLPIYRFCSV